ncbi:MAG: RelA/SpoT family protein [Fibromonadaceae bacterium]|jgi:GTP pyrophosphokinase|nr:RelA/SpoT family protein [Fibromonadaceae bacterium]
MLPVEDIAQSIISINPKLDRELLTKALAFTANAHKGQLRKSGEPYVVHPIEVAKILANLRMDSKMLVVGLLHDVLEDTAHTKSEITEEFGVDIAEMVDSVTKIADMQKGVDNTAKTFKKFLAFISKNPQVIVIKLADRLHNMRTLEFLKEENQRSVSKETLDFYAPLAHRLGLYEFKFELEDLAFKYLQPREYAEIEKHLQLTSKEREDYIQSIIFPLNIKMNLEQLDCDIKGRSKHIFSIWEKMKNIGCKIDELYDIFAIRIIVKQIQDCYIALGYVHNLWMPLYSRFKDYIAVPRPNLYQSLHTTVIGPQGRLVEVQIRTNDMNETAEHGMASHWAYKFNAKKEELEKNMEWVKMINKMQDEIPNSSEFLEFLHKSLLPNNIHAWTPNGTKVNLPLGATILDFAFAVHTELGLRCLGARVANKVLGIDSPVPIGETIQILQSSSQEPQENWLISAKTPKAQAAIKRWLKESVAIRSEILGRKIWQRELQVLRIAEEKKPADTDICQAFSSTDINSFYESLGKGEIPLGKVFNFLKKYSEDNSTPPLRGLFDVFGSIDSAPITIGQNEKSLLNYAKCCNPLPGDKIKGLLKTSKGIEIHKNNCKILNKHPEEHCLTLQWEPSNTPKRNSKCVFRVESIDRVGIEEDILKVISENNARIKKTIFESKESRIKGRIDVLALSSAQINNIEQSLSSVAGVRKVTRTWLAQ